MKRRIATQGARVLAVAGACFTSQHALQAQSPPPGQPRSYAYQDHRVSQPAAPVTADQLVRMSSAELDQLYRSASPGYAPRGVARGIPIVAPGSAAGPGLSRGARLVWQGKVFDPSGQEAVNRFFGVRVVRGRLYQGTSWLDGRTSLILDYDGTSLVYARYRDEIRQVGPNLYLGLMYARTASAPRFTRYFAFESKS